MNSVASVALVAFAGLALTGCPKRAKLLSSSDAGPSASSAASASAPQAPREPWRPSAEWTRAAGLDPLELLRLADAEGATGLLAGVEEGGEVRATALAALPLADDGEAALGRLSELASAAKPADVQPLLEAILGVAYRPLTQREPLDPEGLRGAAHALQALGERKDLSEESRATARSAARALADRGRADARAQ